MSLSKHFWSKDHNITDGYGIDTKLKHEVANFLITCDERQDFKPLKPYVHKMVKYTLRFVWPFCRARLHKMVKQILMCI